MRGSEIIPRMSLRSSGLRLLGPVPRLDARSRGAFAKRIDDGEPADAAPVLHVLAEQRVATGFDGGGDDQCIIEGQPMIFGELSRGDVQIERERQGRGWGPL